MITVRWQNDKNSIEKLKKYIYIYKDYPARGGGADHIHRVTFSSSLSIKCQSSSPITSPPLTPRPDKLDNQPTTCELAGPASRELYTWQRSDPRDRATQDIIFRTEEALI